MLDMHSASSLEFGAMRSITLHVEEDDDNKTSSSDGGGENKVVTPYTQIEDTLYEVKQINKSFQNMASGLQAFSKYVPR